MDSVYGYMDSLIDGIDVMGKIVRRGQSWWEIKERWELGTGITDTINDFIVSLF